MSRTTRKNHLLAGLAAAGVLGVGLAAPTVAFAADGDTPTPGASTSAAEAATASSSGPTAEVAGKLAAGAGRRHRQGDGRAGEAARGAQARRAAREGDRPEKGGKGDPADRQAAMKERLAQAVEDGKLTQEQADAVTAAAEAGVLRPGGRGGHGGPAGK